MYADPTPNKEVNIYIYIASCSDCQISHVSISRGTPKTLTQRHPAAKSWCGLPSQSSPRTLPSHICAQMRFVDRDQSGDKSTFTMCQYRIH